MTDKRVLNVINGDLAYALRSTYFLGPIIKVPRGLMKIKARWPRAKREIF